MHLTFNAAFNKILNVIGNNEGTCCHKMLFYMANKFLWFDLRWFYVADTRIFERCGK